MPQVLTTNATILCPHLGAGISTPTDPKWLVNGGPVLLENDPGVLTCPFIPYPCIGYTLQSMGLNSTTVDGRKVILVTDFQQSVTGLPLTLQEFHTTIDDSTPAPVPAGGSGPPLPPQLADIGKPVVTGTPPSLAFAIATSTPPTAATTFTLASDHPLRWMLTLINEPLKYHLDITSGVPPGLTVSPAGGVWLAGPLTVTVTLTAAYMASLTAGTHHFFMTGISQRGLSQFFEVKLVVS